MTTKPKFPEIENMTEDIEDGLTGANSPAAGNVFATIADLSGIGGTIKGFDLRNTTAPFYEVPFAAGASTILLLGESLGANQSQTIVLAYSIGGNTITGSAYSNPGFAPFYQRDSYNSVTLTSITLFTLGVSLSGPSGGATAGHLRISGPGANQGTVAMIQF